MPRKTKAYPHDPDQTILRYLEHIKTLPVYGEAIADQMSCLMKLTNLLGHLHRRIDDLERASRFAPPMPRDPETPVLH